MPATHFSHDASDAAAAPMRELPPPRGGLLRAVLLVAWAGVSFGTCWFARELDVVVAGWPFGYWMAAQGILVLFIGLVVLYAVAMNRMERREAVYGDAGGAGPRA